MRRLISQMMGGLVLLMMPVLLWADTMVLIPGFQSRGMDWRMNGVAPALIKEGWLDGGNLSVLPSGRQDPIPLAEPAKNTFYTLDLPTLGPIQYQAEILDQYLESIYQYRKEPLTLVGHSAGGVVARHWLVTNNRFPVSTLITIASPHRGTLLTEFSPFLDQPGIAEMANMFGLGHLRNARGLFSDLREERPGTYLFWLNRQPHPKLRYVAIVRNSQVPEMSDIIVPTSSQDMNHIFALQRRAERWNTNSPHYLVPEDGYVLLRILERIAL